MSKQRFGLGRGLDALIPGASSVGADDAGAMTASRMAAVSQPLPAAYEGDPASYGQITALELPIDAITPNEQQPRGPIDEDDELHDLAASIREYGVLQPLLVSLDPDESQGQRFQLIAGERRWRAAQLAGLATVPVVVRDATPRQMIEMALVENLQRSDLNPLEEAHGYLMLIEEYGFTQEQVAERIGRNRATVANTIRLLQLPAEVREALITMPKVFTEGHARAVLMINGEAERITAKNQIIAQQLNVRQAEELARRYNEASLRLTPDRRGAGVRPKSMETHLLEEEFMRAIEMKVRLQRTTKGKGSLTLYFTNEEQLQLLYERIVHLQQQQADAGEFGAGLNGGGIAGMFDSGFTGGYGNNGGGQ